MAITQQMLHDAQTALHDLVTGGAVASFKDQNGETVTYSKTNRGDLVAYIEYLKRELGLAGPAAPMMVWM